MNYYMSDLARQTYEKTNSKVIKRLYEFMMQAADEVANEHGANPPFAHIMQGDMWLDDWKVSNAYCGNKRMLHLVYFDLKATGYADSTRIQYVAKCAAYAKRHHICVYFTDAWVGFETFRYASLNGKRE